jgi:class 3 adenylate cyclase
MRSPPCILVVDDVPANLDILRARLSAHGYEIVTASNGREALAAVREHQPDLILLDVMMPEMDGIEVCRQLRADQSIPFIPIVMLTAKSEPKDVVAALEAGGDEYLTKPVDPGALVARVKSMLRIKGLHDMVHEQNRTLEERVATQVAALERLARLKRFFSPQVAQMIVEGGAEDPLKSHRREVAVVFLDLHGFTGFAETAEPEEVMGVLREYHGEMGRVIQTHEGTLERFAGDGMMVCFNDPVPVPDAATRAVRMALMMHDRLTPLATTWRKRGYDLQLSAGIAHGYATIGAVGFEGRWDYGAIGNVTNLAARLCREALPGQTLIPQRMLAAIEEHFEVEVVGDLQLKGFNHPIRAYNVLRSSTPSELPRKLAAILYADVAGYSRLTSADEGRTHRRLRDYLDLLSAMIERHGGQVVHYAGDAILARFDATTNALECATKIQSEIASRNAGLPDDRRVEFRIGVNLGDVIEDHGDIYGDGVNVAARLETLAGAGEVCVSDSVRVAVGNRLALAFDDLGEQTLKNIDRPVRAFRVRGLR